MTTIAMGTMTPHFLYQAARREAEAHRQELNDRHGRQGRQVSDVSAATAFGDEAISEWNRLHWWQWVCDRVLEHVRGDVFWAELDANRFAVWRNARGQFRAVAEEITSLRDALAGQLNELAFNERQAMEDRLADLVNRLLD